LKSLISTLELQHEAEMLNTELIFIEAIGKYKESRAGVFYRNRAYNCENELFIE